MRKIAYVIDHLLALHVTASDEQDRAQVGVLAEVVQKITGEHVELAHVDQGYTGENAAMAAETHGIRLEVVKHTEAKRGVVCCRAAGWSNATLLGQRASVDWQEITSGLPPPWLDCITWPSPSSCSPTS